MPATAGEDRRPSLSARSGIGLAHVHPCGRLHRSSTHPRRPGQDKAPRRAGDKAYSSWANRDLLPSRKVKAVIPEPRDQIANRKRKGSRGGRPVGFDAEAYKGRAVVEQSFNIFWLRQ